MSKEERARRLNQAKTELGCTATDMAGRLAVSRPHLSRCLSEVSDPSETLVRLAEALAREAKPDGSLGAAKPYAEQFARDLHDYGQALAVGRLTIEHAVAVSDSGLALASALGG